MSDAAEMTRSRRMSLTLLLAAMTAFPPMAIDQYLPALPVIGRDLATSAGSVQWTLSIFFIGFSVGQLALGPLSDRFGRRLPLLAGIVVFIAASLLCAVAGSVEALILWRFVQSLGAAAGAVIARAMVRDLFEGAEAAPILGGYLTEGLGWASNFWALAVFGLLCLVAATMGLPETLPAASRRRVGLPAMLRNYGTLMAHRRFRGYALSSGISFGGYFAYVSGSPFVFIELYRVPVNVFGYLFALNVVGMMIGSAVNSRLVERVGVDPMLAWGLAVGAVAGAALIVLGATAFGGLWPLFAAIFLFVSTQGLVSANAMAGALSVRPDLAGTAAALAGVFSFVVGALVGVLVNALFNGTALPMAAVIAGCAFAALAVERLLVARPRTLW
jgi:DHA1 family bicyclomycin/chloramphenicol resistance-like MFS transporter